MRDSISNIIYIVPDIPEVARLDVRMFVDPFMWKNYKYLDRCTILIFMCIVSDMLKLCTLPSVCSSIRLFVQN